MLGATLPLLVVLGCWVVGARLGTAGSAAIWTAVRAIVVVELVIGIRAELQGRNLIRQTLFGAGLGLLVIALRIVVPDRRCAGAANPHRHNSTAAPATVD